MGLGILMNPSQMIINASWRQCKPEQTQLVRGGKEKNQEVF